MRILATALRATSVCVAAVLAGGASAQAQNATAPADPCSAFEWSLKREQAWLSSPGLRRVALGDTLAPNVQAAVLGLKRYDVGDLPQKSSREPKPNTFAGSFNVPAPATSGVYQVTLSDDGWIEVFQQSETRRPIAHTGKKGCAGLRKSLRFQLDAQPVLIQITDARAETVRIAITPMEELR